jgi:hypothetical protein
MEKALAVLLLIVGLVGLMAIALPVFGLWSGFVISKLWLWLLVPIFHISPLTVPQAMALGMVVAFLAKPNLSDLKKKDDYKWYAEFIYPFVNGGLVLLVASILRHFV